MISTQTRQRGSKDIKEITKDVKELLKFLKPKGQDLKRKVILHKRFLKEDVEHLQEVRNSLLALDDPETEEEIMNEKQSLSTLDRELEKVETEISKLRLKVKDNEQELENLRLRKQEDKENSVYPRVRYVVNLFREVSKISWHPEQQPNEVKGFIRSTSTVKTFCFDESKQSRHFITNSLWEMGEEETW